MPLTRRNGRNILLTVALSLAFLPAGFVTAEAQQVTFDASTLVLANGAVVTSWGAPGAQTAAGTPTYRTNQTPNGMPAVEFNGGGDRMANNVNLPASSAGDWILVVVHRPQNIGAYHNLVDDDAQNRPMLWIDPAFRYELNFSGGTGARAAGTGMQGWDIVIADSRLNRLYVNSPTSNATGRDGVPWLGSANERWDFLHRDGNQTYRGLIAELRLYNNRAAFGNDFAALYEEMRAKWFGAPPTANAGADFSVNEGQTGVTLNGSGSDPDNDPLTYQWDQVGGSGVALSDPSAAQPTFTAPVVALGGETLTFRLTVTAGNEIATDEVSVTVVNINHPPVAEAGDDQSVAEGAPVTLHGEASFDIDTDPFTYTWVQVDNGAPAVALTGATTANPTFDAPYAGTGGAAGVVATLVFELRVDDGFPADAPAPGYTLDNVVDTVTVEITNVNNLPTAEAGDEQTVNENAAVALDAGGSSDPDSDPLTYAWLQTSGPTVTLSDGADAAPSFTAPFVDAGGADLTFQVTVDDGYGGTAIDTVVVHVQNANDPPLASAARPTVASLWPPNHRMVAVGITGVSDPDDNATITITAVRQDEPTMGLGDGDTAVDAVINADGTVLLRAERSGTGNGRVYHIHFTASDYEGSTSGVVTVSVPHSPKKPVVDGGPLHPSTQ